MSWDYVVVGGGSAGCVLASRLTEDRTTRVLLLEAGGWDTKPAIHVPALTAKVLATSRLVWGYVDEPDQTRGGRSMPWLAGRVLGGGSSVNGTVWVRGNAADYDHWAELGCKGWDYDSVLPYFRRAETFEDGPDAWRGGDGPQRVSRVHAPHVLTDAFVRSAVGAGHAFSSDYNGREQVGVAYGQCSTRRGFRHSTARSYLARARRRPNLSVATGAVAQRVLFEGTSAVGVEFRHRGRLRREHARREVIVSAGSIASPKLLLLSGIGNAEHLRRHGIEMVADVPGVGANLQEHPVALLEWHTTVPTFNLEAGLVGRARHGADLVLRGRGPAGAGIFHALLFMKLDDAAAWPEIEAGFAPFGMESVSGDEPNEFDDIAHAGAHDPTAMDLMRMSTEMVFVSLLHPRSRGRLELRSADPAAPPVLRPSLFADPRDLDDLVAGCRAMRRIVETPPMGDLVSAEALPGPHVQSDDEWRAFLRSATFGASHPLGTCKMGVDDDAVVDPTLRVRGVDRLRVVDASVMPTEPSGNTNAPTIMVAERASDLLRQS